MSSPTLHIRRIDSRAGDARAALDGLRESLSPRGNVVSDAGRRRTLEVFGQELSPQQVVERICRDVREQGLAAVLDYSARIDKAELTPETIRVEPAALESAHRRAERAFLESVRRIRDNILEFQRALVPGNVRIERPGGSYLEQRYVPLDRVGICVPGGAAAYPSTVLMTAVPAEAAGVNQRVVIAPPTAYGAYNDDLLATCFELGVTEVYRVGGARRRGPGLRRRRHA